jgi:hypothetical protein
MGQLPERPEQSQLGSAGPPPPPPGPRPIEWVRLVFQAYVFNSAYKHPIFRLIWYMACILFGILFVVQGIWGAALGALVCVTIVPWWAAGEYRNRQRELAKFERRTRR